MIVTAITVCGAVAAETRAAVITDFVNPAAHRAFIVPSGSALALTAVELLDRHQPDPTTMDGRCRACERPAPCPTALHAAGVTSATPPPAALPRAA